MKIVLVLAALALLAGCGDDDETEAPASPQGEMAQLTVTVSTGTGSKKQADISCKEASDSDVCAALADIDPKTFEPIPGNQACTQQYGGPETATVKGTLNGEEIDAKFSRENGCEIARWDAAKKLLGASG
jgi:hypothetical protein